MRQWELIGITDSDPYWTPPRRIQEERVIDLPVIDESGRSVFFWSTDASLRLRTVSSAAAEAIGLPPSLCEGRELLDVFGMEGPNLAVLEAHVTALGGDAGTFTLRGKRGTVRCRVAPMRDADDRVAGTFCIAAPEPATEVLEAALERVRVA